MSSVKEPPTIQPMVDDKTGLPTFPWLLFFDGIFRGDAGTLWTPTLTNLTVVGAAPTITGRVFKIGYLAYFWVRIVPGTNTSAVAGTTYINNFPLVLESDGACFAISGLLGSNSGMCDQASNNIYVPAWTNVTVPLTVVGIVQAG